MGSENSGKNENKRSKDHEHGNTAIGSGSSGGRKGGKKNVISDPRFASVHSDPRFQKVPKHKSKVEIDSRFTRMFTDKSFSGSSAPSDPRGRIKKMKAESFLKHYYRTEEDDEERNVSSEKKEGKNVSSGNKKVRKVSSESESEEERDVSIENEEVGSKSEVELKTFDDAEDESEPSDNESEFEEDETESSTDEEDLVFEEEDDTDVEVENIPTIEDGTRRLAVVNLDWRHVRAVDLYVVLSSFLPKGGDILSVAIYPSEFGLERMKEEELHGPVGLFDDENKKKKKDDDDEDEDDEIDEEKLRAYERSRLRYYYAVVECDSVATAEYLYKNCDGVEFERSSNVFDLRFIPDSMEFKHPPRDVAKEAPASYEGLDFHTRALQHSNVPISWDEDEPQRVKSLKQKFTADQLAEMELQEFLASDESESDDEDDDDGDDGDDGDNSDDGGKKSKKRDKYRALIQSGDCSDDENDEEGQDMEITFHSGLEGLSKRILEKRDKKSETIWEAHLRKQKEKKAQKRKSKYLSDDESSDPDQEITEDADDFFVDEEEPSVKKGMKDGKAKKKNKDRELPDSDKEGEATQAELELLLADDNEVDNGVKGYNLNRIKSKVKKGKEVAEENKIPTAVYNDPRFSALFTSPLFALDPTDPQFKRSTAYARQMVQRQRKGVEQETGDGEDKQPQNSQLPTDSKENENKNTDVASLKEKHEISALVRSIKMKSKQVQLPTIGKHKKEKSQSRGGKEMETPEVPSLEKKARIMKN